MSCKVAIIGAGYMAEEHIKAFSAIQGVIISGIHSRTYEKAAQLSDKYHFSECNYHSIEELYEKSKADIVVISVSELAVHAISMEAFRFPWVCLIEKPAGYNYYDALSIAKAAESNNRRVFVALNRRMYSSTRKVLNELSNSSAPRLIHVFDQEDPATGKLLGKPELVVNNWMYANSVHMIDFFNVFGRGNIIAVEPVVTWNPEHPSFVVTKIAYDSGDIGIYEAVWNAPGPWAVTITTHAKRWELRPLEQASIQLYGSRKVDLLETDEWDQQFKPGLRSQAEEVVKAALGQATSLATIGDAMKTMSLIKQIYS
jgi:predicted dehydrogenase